MNKRNTLNTDAGPCRFAEIVQEEELQVWMAEWKMLLALAKGAHGNRKYLCFERSSYDYVTITERWS